MVVILVLLTILTFLTVDYFVERAAQRRTATVPAPAPVPAPIHFAPTPDLTAAPPGLFLGPGHAWLEVEKGGAVRIGADHFAPALLGALDRVELVPAGTEIARGDVVAVLARGERHVPVRSPVDGVVTAVNRDLAADPDRLASDPFGEGWLARMAPRRLTAAVAGMSIADDARRWLLAEASRLRDRLFELAAGPEPALATAPDGGLPVEGVAIHLADGSWQELVDDFFTAAG